MATVTLLTNPATYSPVYAECWFQMNSGSSSVSDFKYLASINKIDLLTSASTKLGNFKLPPRPNTGDGLFTPHKLLISSLSYNLQPFIYKLTAAPNSILKYNMNYGFQYNPGLDYYNAFNSGGYLGITFSTPTTTNFLVGDIITITKDNTQSNPQYNGTSSVTNILNSYSLRTDKIFVTSSVSDSGTITGLKRNIGTSSNLYAFNGTRQYDEIKTNFSKTRVFTNNSKKVDFLTNYRTDYNSIPTSYNDFSTNYDYLSKRIYSYNYETLSFMADLTSMTDSNLKLYSIGYYSNAIQSTFSYIGSVQTVSNLYKRYDIPVSPSVLYSATGSELLFNGTFSSSLGGWGNTSSVSFGAYSTFSIATNQAVYDGQFDSNGLQLINNVTSLLPNTEYTVSITIATASSPYENIDVSIFLGDNYTSLTASQIYTPGTYTFNMYSGTGTQSKISVDTDGQGGRVVFTNMSIKRTLIPEYYAVVASDTSDNIKAVKYYKIVDNCSPYPDNFRIAFLNRMGGFDYWNFNWKSTNSMKLSRTEWKKVLDWNYNIGDRSDSILSTKANESYQISSDWITEYESKFLKELITSPEVYLVDEEDKLYYPIIITDDSYVVKTSIDNKLFAINLNMRFAYDINLQNN